MNPQVSRKRLIEEALLPPMPEKDDANSESIIAKADSGALQHYFWSADVKCLHNIHGNIGPPVTFPLGNKVNSNKAGHLPVNGLPSHATKVRILGDLKSASLVSLGQLATPRFGELKRDKEWKEYFERNKR